jgi:hypothetical protein
MVKLARVLLVALVTLVVPLQGMAAVAAGQCMALGHHDDPAGHASHGHAQHGHDGHDSATHSHSDEGDSMAEEDQGGAHCGPCTACCASATIAAANDLSIPASPSSAPYVFWQFPPFGDRPDNLDRPPLAL